MRTGEDCFVCFMKQAHATLRRCSEDHALRCRILQEVSGMMSNFSLGHSPPENAALYYRHISRVTGVGDPFLLTKQQSNEKALHFEKNVRRLIAQSPDPVLAAVKFAIGANVLDSGAQKQFDLETTLEKCLDRRLDIDHYSSLRGSIASKKNIVYLCDNCGEIVFDKLLIEQLITMGCKITAVVRSSPVINDATYDDAVSTGLTDVCPVVTNGTDIPGTSLRQCSETFKQLFKSADCIISKGMGNFECLSAVDAPIFFLFTVKCSTVSKYLAHIFYENVVTVGSPVVLSRAEYDALEEQ